MNLIQVSSERPPFQVTHQLADLMSYQSLQITDDLDFAVNMFIEMFTFTFKLNSFMIIERSWGGLYDTIGTHVSAYNHPAVNALANYLAVAGLIASLNQYVGVGFWHVCKHHASSYYTSYDF